MLSPQLVASTRRYLGIGQAVNDAAEFGAGNTSQAITSRKSSYARSRTRRLVRSRQSHGDNFSKQISPLAKNLEARRCPISHRSVVTRQYFCPASWPRLHRAEKLTLSATAEFEWHLVRLAKHLQITWPNTLLRLCCTSESLSINDNCIRAVAAASVIRRSSPAMPASPESSELQVPLHLLAKRHQL